MTVSEPVSSSVTIFGRGEYIRLRRAANAGALTMDNADLLSRLATAVFKGMFVEYPYEPGKSDHLEAAAEECYQLILEII